MAALITVVHHFFLAFLYRYHGALPGTNTPKALVGSPLFFLINGKGAVVVFFVLSGYVLALKGFRESPVKAILEAMAKRWVRLAPLVCASALFAYGLFSLGMYHYEDVADINGSPWLTGSRSGQQLPEHSHPTLHLVLAQSLYRVFLYGDATLNTNLWTMQWEFYGSFLVLTAALFLSYRLVLWPALLLSASWLLWHYMWLFPFMLGVFAASLRLHERKLDSWISVALTVIALYLCGYFFPQDAYAWLQGIPMDEVRLRILIQSLGALILVTVFASDDRISRVFNGPRSRQLGMLSFPLYLFHTLLITSVSCKAYLLAGGGDLGIAAAAVALAVTLFPLAWILGLLDRKWLDFLARWKL